MEDIIKVNYECPTVVLERGSGTTCAVNLQGGVITSWRVEFIEQIFVSNDAIFDTLRPIRGGICISFPRYARWPLGPDHGFSRLVKWKLVEGPKKIVLGDIYAVFSLSDVTETRSIWYNNFTIFSKLILREKDLDINITIVNTNPTSLVFNMLVHSFFKVPEVRNCKMFGLKGIKFRDSLGDEDEFYEEEDDPLTLSEYTDKIYHKVPNTIIISGLQNDKYLKIVTENLPDMVIWNPWRKLTRKLPELSRNDWKMFVCIEPGHVQEMLYLKPGEIFNASMSLSVMDTIEGNITSSVEFPDPLDPNLLPMPPCVFFELSL